MTHFWRVVSLGMLLLALESCASPKVIFSAATDGTTPDVADAVAAAASTQSQVFTLPVSRLLVSAPATGGDAPTSSKKPVKPSPAPPQSGTGTGTDAGSTSGAGTTTTTKDTGASANGGNGTSGDSAVAIGGGYSASVIPVEGGRYYRVQGVNNFWSETNLQLTKMPNSDVPTVVSVDFTDETPSRITDIVSVLSSAAIAGAAFAEGTPNSTCSKSVPLSDFAMRLDASVIDGSAQTIPNQPCWIIRIDGTKIPPQHDIVPITYLDQVIAKPGTSPQAVGYFPVPACLDVLLTITEQTPTGAAAPPELLVYSQTIRITDPAHMRLFGLPEKGKISMHPVCDADSSNTPTDPYEAYFQAAGTVLDKAKSVQDAITSSGSSSTSTGGSAGGKGTAAPGSGK
jgi:hypothetical protein